MISSDLTIHALLFRFFAGMIIAAVQGATIAAVAVMLGDRGPKHDGRLTLSPIAHLDLLGLASIMLTGFGWSKPVAIEAAKLRGGRWGLVVAALAGSVALLAVAFLLAMLVVPALTMLPYTAGLTTAAFLRTAAPLCVWMALFTLLPVPPLAGAHFLESLGLRLPPATGLFIGVGLLLASTFGITRTALLPLFNIIAPLVLGPGLAA